ncbi:MAG: hypothetical protein EOO27_14265 [Comamonadaceae bacterium]|nr:MAG: hypothetical protein EOO27_14265 [Comamonadaceae bacterium]
MNTIVCNTLTGAVSEYTRYAFQSITPRYGGSATGLFELVGETDDGLPIVANLRLPATLQETTLKKHLGMVFLSMHGGGCARFTVFGMPAPAQWHYSFSLLRAGVTRAEPGRGICENYMGFGVSTPAGQRFTLDRIEVLALESKQRRTKRG